MLFGSDKQERFKSMGSSFFFTPQIKRSVFVSYHHKHDQWYYNEFSRYFSKYYSMIRDNSLDQEINSDDCDYVFRRIRDNYISGSSATIVLCGLETTWRKYVDWEIKATLDKCHGLIGVYLPTAPTVAGSVVVPERLEDNLKTGYAVWVSWNYLIANPTQLPSLVEQANAKSKRLIDNSRSMRKINGNPLRRNSLFGLY